MTLPPDLIQSLRQAKRVAVMTGAGVSSESGIPTFRDALTGLWARFNPSDLANVAAFRRDPVTVTQWYDHRRCDCLQCQPNAGHAALAKLEQAMAARDGEFTLITQNVDRLHQRAGSRNVLELHGSLYRWSCTGCGEEAEEFGPPFGAYPPKCLRCGGMRRPAIVWFGEALPPDTYQAAEDAANSADLFMTLGTSGSVWPAAGLTEQAIRRRTPVLEINPDQTPFSDEVSWSLRGKSGEVLPCLVAAAIG